MRNLSEIDLNLLVTLETLLTERNVTRTAKRLRISQPSVSVRLTKLRKLFDDPLLLPGPRGMQPTARAMQLLEPIRAILTGVSHMLDLGTEFDPAKARVTWHVACADYAEQAILLPVIAKLRDLAPLSRLAIHPLVPSDIAQMSETGVIDLALMVIDTAPPGMRRRILFTEHYVLVARQGHPTLSGSNKPTLAQFCELEFVVISPDGGGFRGPTDVMLSTKNKRRRVPVSVPHFLFVPEILRHSNLVAMLPSRILAGNRHGLRVLDSPLAIPTYEMAAIWHERSHLDPAHRWFRQLLADSVAAEGKLSQ